MIRFWFPPLFDNHAKGQLISEEIFLVLNSSKKRTQYLKFFALATRAEVFRSFFGRIEIKIIGF